MENENVTLAGRARTRGLMMQINSEQKYCNWCEEEASYYAKISPIGPHFGEWLCERCDNRWGFIGKPKNDGRCKPNKFSPLDLGVDYCQMCLRTRKQLVNHETLEIHHVIQVAEGGDDSFDNI